MSDDPIAVLESIVAEVAGAGQPFSADSYLPPHLVHDARQAIEAESKSATEWKAREAHESLLLARLAKADEVIASLRAEIDALRRTGINLALPPGQIIGHGILDSRTLKYDPQACAKLAQELTQIVNAKYDPDACAESVRDKKECGA